MVRPVSLPLEVTAQIFSNSTLLLAIVDGFDRFEDARVDSPASPAERTSAFTSFGKHEPP